MYIIVLYQTTTIIKLKDNDVCLTKYKTHLLSIYFALLFDSSLTEEIKNKVASKKI